MDEYEQADQERRRLLAIECSWCGQARTVRCVDAGGRTLPITRQHVDRYRDAEVEPSVLRVLLAKARLV